MTKSLKSLSLQYHKHVNTLLQCFLFCQFFLVTHAYANDKNAIDALLLQTQAPVGVVFELIGRENGQYLPNALEKIEHYKQQLKVKFPSIKIAIVSHGAEQFELTQANAKNHSKTHNLVQRISAEDVPVHICETHASWRDVSAEDFPEYITVSSQAPKQIKHYQQLGYQLIIVD